MDSLFGTHKHVQEFSPDDDDYEYEEEEIYVTLDLGVVDPSLFPSTSSYRLIGLDTPTPFLQLSNTVFKGEHEELVGTELLFQDGRDETNKSRRFVVPAGTSERRIRFREVELVSKTDEAAVDKTKLRKIGARSGIAAATGTSTRGMGTGRGRGRGFTQRKKKDRDENENENENEENEADADADSLPKQSPKSKRKGKGKAADKDSINSLAPASQQEGDVEMRLITDEDMAMIEAAVNATNGPIGTREEGSGD